MLSMFSPIIFTPAQTQCFMQPFRTSIQSASGSMDYMGGLIEKQLKKIDGGFAGKLEPMVPSQAVFDIPRQPQFRPEIGSSRRKRLFGVGWFLEWPGGQRPLNSTWPWSGVKLSILVLWGVCWMFYMRIENWQNESHGHSHPQSLSRKAPRHSAFHSSRRAKNYVPLDQQANSVIKQEPYETYDNDPFIFGQYQGNHVQGNHIQGDDLHLQQLGDFNWSSILVFDPDFNNTNTNTRIINHNNTVNQAQGIFQPIPKSNQLWYTSQEYLPVHPQAAAPRTKQAMSHTSDTENRQSKSPARPQDFYRNEGITETDTNTNNNTKVLSHNAIRNHGMVTSQSAQSEEVPYRSYKELQSDHVHVLFSPATKRLFWPLDGVFPTSISVMKTPRSPDDLEPYFQPNIGGRGSPIWHEISRLPLTEPKVSSIEASVYDLNQWEFDWVAWHRDHAGGELNPEYATYGDLSDKDRPYANNKKKDGRWEDSDTEFLLKCCGEDRPLGKRGIKLVVTPSAGNHFVTVHDYVSAVHPWLMSLRKDILKAKAVARPQPYSASAPTEWMVNKGPEHKIEEKEGWIRDHGGGLARTMPASTDAILNRIRASSTRLVPDVSNLQPNIKTVGSPNSAEGRECKKQQNEKDGNNENGGGADELLSVAGVERTSPHFSAQGKHQFEDASQGYQELHYQQSNNQAQNDQAGLYERGNHLHNDYPTGTHPPPSRHNTYFPHEFDNSPDSNLFQNYHAARPNNNMSLSYESRTYMADTQYPMQMAHETQEQDEFKAHDEPHYPSPPPPMSENPYTAQSMTADPDHTLELPELPKEEDAPSPGRSKPVPKPDREITKDANGRFYCSWPGCTEETKDFVRKCEWSKHMDKHDRPYRCKETGCEKLPGFTYSGGLLRHEREVHGKHGGPKKQLNCPHPNCKRHTGKGFSRQENLNEHLRRVHTDTEMTQMTMGETEEDASQAVITGLKRKRGSSKEDTSELETLREEIKKIRAENEELKRNSQAQQAQTAEVMRQLVELQNLATLQHPRMTAPQAPM
ncbi:hypothetical protein NHQ30_007185 [Ciborinia camelliae]|nr:hypothetical protein NHQ30_007185 [Ciborinia camelliae]